MALVVPEVLAVQVAVEKELASVSLVLVLLANQVKEELVRNLAHQSAAQFLPHPVFGLTAD